MYQAVLDRTSAGAKEMAGSSLCRYCTGVNRAFVNTYRFAYWIMRTFSIIPYPSYFSACLLTATARSRPSCWKM
jgi:hypothetical protein